MKKQTNIKKLLKPKTPLNIQGAFAVEKEKYKKTSQTLNVIRKCDQALIYITDEQKLLNAICKIIINYGPYKFAWVGCAENDKNKSVKPIAQAGYEQGYLKSLNISWANNIRGNGPTGTAIRTKKVTVCKNMLTDPKFKPWRSEAIKYGYISSISLPIQIEDAFGALSIYSPKPDAFSKKEINLLVQLTNNLTFGIKNIRKNLEKIKIEKELNESEKKYYELFNRAVDAIFIANPETRKIVDCNKSAEKLTGFSKSEIVKMKFSDLHPKELKKNVASAFKKHSDGKIVQVYAEVQTKDKKIIPVSINSSLVHIKNKPYLQGIFRDITSQKEAEKKIREYNQQFEKLSDNVPGLIFQFTRTSNGEYFVPLASKGIKQIFGCLPNDVVDSFKPIAKVIHPEDSARVINDIEYSAKHLTYFICEFRVKIPGKPIQWVYCNSKPEKKLNGIVTWYGYIYDITDRKNIETKLMESEEKYKGLISNLPKTEYVVVHRNAKILWITDSTSSFLGYAKNNIIGSSVLDYVVKEDRHITSQNIKRRMSGKKVFDYEIRIINSERKIINVLVKGSLIDFEGQRAALLILSDITERIKKDRGILKEKQFLDNIINFNPNPIQIYDKDGHNVRVNEAYMRMFKVPPTQDYNWFEDPVAIKLGLHEQQQLIKKGKRVKFPDMTYNPHWVRPEFPDVNVAFDLNVFPIMDSNNQLDKFVLMYEDITERKAAEIKIKESEEKLRKVFENSTVGISIVGPDGKWIKVNNRLCNILGYSEKELLASGYLKVTFPDDIQKTKDFNEKFISGKIISGHLIKRYVHKDGHIVWVEIGVSLVKGLDGKPQYFVVTTDDITLRKELDEAKEGFLSIASHQLRTPLSITKWVLESLLYEKNLTPKQLENYNDLIYSNERLIKLVNDLLNVSAIDTGKLSINKNKVDINKLITDISLSLKTMAEKNGKNIKIINNTNNGELYGDPALISEALENLLTNAINYSSKGSNDITIRVNDRASDYVISVHNDGYIEPDIQEKIKKYEKFVRGSNATEVQPTGSGLGLYITNKVMEASGGSIWFKSNAKQGTSFYMSINKK